MQNQLAKRREVTGDPGEVSLLFRRTKPVSREKRVVEVLQCLRGSGVASRFMSCLPLTPDS